MRLILFGGYFFGKMWKNMEKQPFFRTAMAGLGKYHMGDYGRIGVYRVIHQVKAGVYLLPDPVLPTIAKKYGDLRIFSGRNR